MLSMTVPEYLDHQKKAVWDRSKLAVSFPEDAVSKTV